VDEVERGSTEEVEGDDDESEKLSIKIEEDIQAALAVSP
jgi:hypothetical protein